MWVTCDNPDCGVEFSKKPEAIRKTKHNFCSRECHWRWLTLERIKRYKREGIRLPKLSPMGEALRQEIELALRAELLGQLEQR